MARLPEEIVSALAELIVGSPYGRLLGLELLDAEEDRVRIQLPYRPAIATVGDTVHGGAISGLVDSAATASFWASAKVGPGSRGTTIGFAINFVSPARGTDLVATATVRRRGREISTGEVSVRDPRDREVAIALVTYKLTGAAT